MPSVENPAIAALIAMFESELVFGQVLIRKNEGAFDLRHVADRDGSEAKLLRLTREELRRWTQRTDADAYRPLKSSPTLAPGWIYHCAQTEALDDALQILYPGSVADWCATLALQPPVTHYREFTNRQTGMYRITQLLSDAQGASVIEAVCDSQFCLKRRFWSIASLQPDPAEDKSIIPCLEPCAVLLEFARKAMRMEQEGKISLQLAPSEWASIEAALQQAITGETGDVREADVSDATNLRRLQLLLIRLRTMTSSAITKE